MRIYIDTLDGMPFPLEISSFDTVRYIKENVEAQKGIPISHQTVLLGDVVLPDDDSTVESCGIYHLACVFVMAKQDHWRIRLQIITPVSLEPFTVEVDTNDTIKQLKEKIYEKEDAISVDRLALQVHNVELRDYMSISDCNLVDNSHIEVFIKPSLPRMTTAPASTSTAVPPATISAAMAPATTSMGSGKQLVVRVIPWEWNSKIKIEVNEFNKVNELRAELERLQPLYNFHLPPDGYFFIHKQDWMDENHTFRWHGVKDGDTIEVFRGQITGISDR